MADKKTIMKFIPIYILLAIVFLSSCKEEGLMTYDVKESGSSLYFTEKIDRKSKDTLMKVISLGRTADELKDSVITIPVSISGPAMSFDRPINIEIPDTASMKLGVHFDYVTPPMIRADRVTDLITLVLHRTPDLKQERVYLKLDLKANEHFNPQIPIKINSNIKQDITSYSLSYDDMFPVPHLWTTFPNKTAFIGYFGPYSKRKVELILEVLQLDPELLYNPLTPPAVAQLINWSSYMKYWLNNQKANGNTQYDENNKEIEMGPNAR